MKYKLSAEAISDLKQIYYYTLSNFGEAQADRYLSRLHETFDMLCRDPGAGKTAEFEKLIQFRKMLSDSHFIYYEICKDFIGISRVLHSTKDVNEFNMRPFQ